MTDEELEEAADHAETKMVVECNGDYTKFKKYKDGFRDGYNAGRPKWHTDPNDLPPMIQDERHISERVWINVKNWGTEDGHYDYNKNCWIIRCRIVNLDVIAWCEIPKFKEDK